jgi:type II secretory pathway pseudopilin PulG
MTNRRAARSTPAAAARLRPRPGFMLVSVMVAVVLLATAVMAIGAANTTRIKAQTLSTSKGAALNVARQHLENLRSQDPWSLASESGVRVDASGTPSATGDFRRSVAIEVVRQNLIIIKVTVEGDRLPQPITLVTNSYRGGTMTPRA